MKPVTLFLATLLVAPALPAQSTSPFQRSRLVPRTDSFAVLMQGRAIGSTRETIERTAEGYRLTSVQQMAGMSQSTQVDFSPTLAMRHVKQSGQVRGAEMKIDVVYAGGRARGTATTPGQQGMKTIAVDTVVPAGAVDDNVLQSLLPTLPLAEGKSFTVDVFASGQGISKPVTIQVSGADTVTVPAGSFDAWRLLVTGGPVPVTFWVSKADPRVVKMAITGAPMSFELVK
jgi:hypothetical protein